MNTLSFLPPKARVAVPWWLNPGFPMAPGERLSRFREAAARKIAWALPSNVLYWAVIRAAVTVEPNSSPEGVTAVEMLEVLTNSEATK